MCKEASQISDKDSRGTVVATSLLMLRVADALLANHGKMASNAPAADRGPGLVDAAPRGVPVLLDDRSGSERPAMSPVRNRSLRGPC